MASSSGDAMAEGSVIPSGGSAPIASHEEGAAEAAPFRAAVEASTEAEPASGPLGRIDSKDQALRDEFMCSICMELLLDPVTLDCQCQCVLCRHCVIEYFETLHRQRSSPKCPSNMRLRSFEVPNIARTIRNAVERKFPSEVNARRASGDAPLQADLERRAEALHSAEAPRRRSSSPARTRPEGNRPDPPPHQHPPAQGVFEDAFFVKTAFTISFALVGLLAYWILASFSSVAASFVAALFGTGTAYVLLTAGFLWGAAILETLISADTFRAVFVTAMCLAIVERLFGEKFPSSRGNLTEATPFTQIQDSDPRREVEVYWLLAWFVSTVSSIFDTGNQVQRDASFVQILAVYLVDLLKGTVRFCYGCTLLDGLQNLGEGDVDPLTGLLLFGSGFCLGCTCTRLWLEHWPGNDWMRLYAAPAAFVTTAHLGLIHLEPGRSRADLTLGDLLGHGLSFIILTKFMMVSCGYLERIVGR